ncbi:MAG TPA: 2-phospho-L-lactate transferase CofD family protein, partial [Spirochaetia bacterium]|nr:2-phospho-L-lactate transferase CofD family protein [Spirochaetia bacterium]
KKLSCIAASMDSGGKTGIIRSDERDQVIAISDLLRTLISLIVSTNHQKNIQAFTDLLSFTDGRQRNLGYTIYYALLEMYQNDFIKAQKHFERLLGIKFDGTVIPVTTDSSNLCFETCGGTVFRGEHELDKQSMSKNSIVDLWLDPDVPATPQAITAIEAADYVIYCPGSLYGSVLSNFLPIGIKEALATSKAQKILITNLVSNRNQTHHFTPEKYVCAFRKYTGLENPIDIILAPHIGQKAFEKRFPKVAKAYALEHAHFLGWTDNELKDTRDKGIKVLTSDIISITPQLNRLRHDSRKLAKVFRKLIG